MKSFELFDILGEIDDKFFEEAKQPDVQHGEIVIAESRPFGSFMSIFAPIAACVAIIAAVVIGANFVSKNAGIVKPNDSDSTSDVTLSSDVSTVSNTESSVSTTESESSVPPVDDRKIRLEEYPPINLAEVPDIKGSGLEAQMGHYDELLQKATLATLKCGDYELYMLGEYIHVDKSYNDNLLYSYYVQLAVVKDGEVISTDGPHTFSVSMGQGGYKLCAFDLNNYLEYYELNGANLVIFKYHYPDQQTLTEYVYESTFLTISDDGKLSFLMGDFSGINRDRITITAYLNESYTVDTENNTLHDRDVVYKFNCENFALNPYDAVHFTAEYDLDLSEYPMLDMEQVPHTAGTIDWADRLPKATLAEKQIGYYKLSLIAKNISSFEDMADTTIMGERMRTVVTHNDKIVYVSKSSLLKGDVNYLESELMPAYEMNYGVVFDTDDGYCKVEGDQMVKFSGNYSAIEGVEPPADYDEHDPRVIVIPTENALILHGAEKYTFDFNTTTFTVSYTGEEPLLLYEYMIYDKERTTAQPKVILEEKEAGGYKFYLLGNNVENFDFHDDMRGTTTSMFSYTKLIVAVEKDGRLVDSMAAFTTNVKYWETAMIGQYLRPFEMKDGIGFVMYVNLQASGTNTYAMIYQIANDTITNIKYEYDFAPASPMGSPWAMDGDFNVVPENNEIVYKNYKGEVTTLTIDFANNLFSQME